MCVVDHFGFLNFSHGARTAVSTKTIASAKTPVLGKTVTVVALSELIHGQEADLFALLSGKEELTTRDGKPYFKVSFRDHAREVSFPIWSDSTWAIECRERWRPGIFYKLRAIYRDTNFGPQLDIKKIRETVDADSAEGFDPLCCQKRTRFDPAVMFEELTALVWDRIPNAALRSLVVDILAANREQLQSLPAATRNHHAYLGGWIEHVLSVTRTAAFLADKYDELYSDMQPRWTRDWSWPARRCTTSASCANICKSRKGPFIRPRER